MEPKQRIKPKDALPHPFNAAGINKVIHGRTTLLRRQTFSSNGAYDFYHLPEASCTISGELAPSSLFFTQFARSIASIRPQDRLHTPLVNIYAILFNCCTNI
jgi:hypothetical protein